MVEDVHDASFGVPTNLVLTNRKSNKSANDNILIESEDNEQNLDSFEDDTDLLQDQEFEKIEVFAPKPIRSALIQGENLPDIMEASDESDCTLTNNDDSIALISNEHGKSFDSED